MFYWTILSYGHLSYMISFTILWTCILLCPFSQHFYIINLYFHLTSFHVLYLFPFIPTNHTHTTEDDVKRPHNLKAEALLVATKYKNEVYYLGHLGQGRGQIF